MKAFRVFALAYAIQFPQFTVLAQTCDFDWDVSIGNPGFNSDVAALAVHDDGAGPALYAGGAFTSAGGVSAFRVARWDGEHWNPLGSGFGGGNDDPGSKVHALASFDDGLGPALYAGGVILSPAGDLAARVAIWRNGTWSALDLTYPNGFPTVNTMVVFNDGSGPALYVGGSFTKAGAVTANCIAKWNGQRWSALGQGVEGEVKSMTVFDDGGGPTLYITGHFNLGRHIPFVVAKWDGRQWVGLAGGKPRGICAISDPCPTPPVCWRCYAPQGNALAVFDRGFGEELFLSGFFSGAGRVKAQNIVGWTGEGWFPLTGNGILGTAFAMTSHDDGNGIRLYVAGGIQRAGSISVNNIARWDGLTWSALGAGVGTGFVESLISFDDGTGAALYVAGAINTAGGQPTQNIARWKCPE